MLSQQVTILSQDAIDRFHSSLSERGKSPETAKAYTTDLKMMLQDLAVTEIPMETFEQTAMSWLQSKRKIVAPKTTGRRLTALRSFAKWAGWGAMLTDYSAPTPARGTPHPLPEGIDGVLRLIAATPNEKQKCLIALCGLCGCRVAEALSIKPTNFNLDEMTLTIRGKGDKTRVVPVSSRAWQVLAAPTTRAFVAGGAEVVGLRDRFARRIISELGVKAKLQRHISSHDLRATFATAVYDKTQDLRLVQELLGHASSQTTEGYTLVSMNKMKDAVEL